MAPLAAGLHFMVFLGSVRENRNADRVKTYLVNALQARNITFTIFDPKELHYTKVVQPLHYYPNQADAPQQLRDHNEQIKRANGYLVVTPEYHGAIAPSLSTMMDQFPPLSYAMKPAGIVSYSKGPYGDGIFSDGKQLIIFFKKGIRAAMQLRVYLSELGLVHVPSLLAIPKVEDNIMQDGQTNNLVIRNSTEALLGEMVWFAEAIRTYANVKEILYKGKPWSN